MSRTDRRIALATVALALLACFAGPLLAQPPAAGHLTFDDLFDAARTGATPDALAWTPDGSGLSYLWDAGDGEALWLMDAETGVTRKLFEVSALTAAANGPGETGEADDGSGATPSPAAVDAYHWAPDSSTVLIESDGDLFLWRPAEGFARLTDTPAAEEAPSFSPDGRQIAFVRDANLYLYDLADGTERALTDDGEAGVTLNATNDWVYGEEIWDRDPTGYWWSPNGAHIVYYRFDETPVDTYTLIPDPVPVYPTPKVQHYPKAGTTNPGVRLGVVDVASGAKRWLDTAVAPARGEVYLARVHWSPDSTSVAIERLNRDQTDLDLLSCDPATGGCRTILNEHADTWVDLGNDTTLLEDGRILWASARTGWRHLYLYGPPGPGGHSELIRPLTSGDWAVESVDYAGPTAAIVTAYGTGPLGAATRRILLVPYDGSPAEPLSEENGWNTARVAPDGEHWVHGWSDANHPGWQRLETAGGETVTELPETAPAFDPAALPQWTIFRIPGPGGVELPAAMLLPPNVDPSDITGEPKVPAIMYHYGCPASQVVADRWGRRGRGLWHKLMAQRGFVILMVDNRGSLFFGKRGAERAFRRMGAGNLAAQKAAVAYLDGLPFVDPERIGLWGWSGGGSNTLYALLNAPGTWRAGVAGAPVTDWHYYDTIWTERYLDRPQDNPAGYAASSPITYADHLADHLLIIHGTADDNVHPQNTLAMADALVAADKPFDMAIYPQQKHGFRGAAERHVYERIAAYFERWLKGGGAGGN